MSITLVGQAGLAGVNSASPVGITYTSTAGNALILTGFFVTTGSVTGITGVTDTAGNVWQFSTVNAQKPPSQTDTAAGSTIVAFVAWTLAAAAQTKVTITNSTGLSSDFWRVSLSEWSGIVVADKGAATQAASGANPSLSVSPATSGQLIVGVCNSVSGSVTAQPAGWTDFSGSGSVAGIAFNVPVGPGTVTAQWTMASSDYLIVLMTFSPSPLVTGGGSCDNFFRSGRMLT